MFSQGRCKQFFFWMSVWAVCVATTGCLRQHTLPTNAGVPTELSTVQLPEHTIAPPDILLIDAVTLVPRPPYLIKPLDALFIQVKVIGAKDDDKKTHLIPGQPIDGVYRVEPDGTVNLGFDYGSVKVVGLGVPDAKLTIKANLLKRFKADFDVTVTLAESRAMQQIRGPHLTAKSPSAPTGAST